MSEIKKLAAEKISPVEIKNKEFKKSIMGYSPHEVILFLDQVAKQWEHVQAGEKRLSSTVDDLRKEIDVWQTRERELEHIRAAALEEAEKIRGAATDHGKKLLQEAREQASSIQGKTQEWLADIIVRLQDTEKRRQTLSSELRKKLEEHFSLLEDAEKLGGPLEDRLANYLDGTRQPTKDN
ncbi:MAG: DivIVA domain-containing protein [Deltaproteobacteria bacterium]|nr:DivIVA domain-containing protein [Deltaproteobacteria bacterium]MBI3293633.1 DivIVA domain-containing protein [Deltaproteobacteria bacterium]